MRLAGYHDSENSLRVLGGNRAGLSLARYCPRARALQSQQGTTVSISSSSGPRLLAIYSSQSVPGQYIERQLAPVTVPCHDRHNP
jgi:hypothetical protein